MTTPNDFEQPAEAPPQPTETHSEPPKGSHGSAHDDDATTGPHGSMADHGGDHGHDDHGHASEALGPIDMRAWGAGIGGIAIGLVVVLVIARAAGAL
jgi:hypothetical protein